MTDIEVREEPFIRYLAGLAERDDRAALAALRRGLGRTPGMAPELYPHVARFFGQPNRVREDAMFVVAALFGMLPKHRTGAGSPLKVLRQLDLDSDSTERRVLALLNADTESLPIHLRHCFALIKSHGPDRSLDYQQLLWDITRWNSPERWVQRNWARDWWAGAIPREPGGATEGSSGDVDVVEVATQC